MGEDIFLQVPKCRTNASKRSLRAGRCAGAADIRTDLVLNTSHLISFCSQCPCSFGATGPVVLESATPSQPQGVAQRARVREERALLNGPHLFPFSLCSRNSQHSNGRRRKRTLGVVEVHVDAFRAPRAAPAHACGDLRGRLRRAQSAGRAGLHALDPTTGP